MRSAVMPNEALLQALSATSWHLAGYISRDVFTLPGCLVSMDLIRTSGWVPGWIVPRPEF